MTIRQTALLALAVSLLVERAAAAQFAGQEEANARQLLEAARTARQSSQPLARQLELYNLAIQKNSQVATAYFERARLRWEQLQTVDSEIAQQLELLTRKRIQRVREDLIQLRNDTLPDAIQVDLDQAQALGLNTPEFEALRDQCRAKFGSRTVRPPDAVVREGREQAHRLLGADGFDAALRYWDGLVERYPGALEVAVARFEFYSEQGKPSAVAHRRELDRVLALCVTDNPLRGDIYLSRLEFLKRSGLHDELQDGLSQYSQRFPGKARTRECFGWLAFDLGKYETAHLHLAGALGELEQTSQLDRPLVRLRRQVEILGRLFTNPRDAVGLAQRANAWTVVGDNAKALADYSRVVELSPQSVLARCWRAGRYIASGKAQEALADIDAALKVDPRSAAAYTCRGALAQSQLRIDEALADYKQALELSPRRREACQRRAQIFFFRGQFEPMLEELAALALSAPVDEPLLLPVRLATPLPGNVTPPMADRRAMFDSDPADGAQACLLSLLRGDALAAADRFVATIKYSVAATRLAYAISLLTREEDQDLFAYREIDLARLGRDSWQNSSVKKATDALGLSTKPEVWSIVSLYDGGEYRPIASLYRHEPFTIVCRRDRPVAKEYAAALQRAQQRSADAKYADDLLALANIVDDAQAIELLTRIELAPSPYADPLLPNRQATAVRQQAGTMLSAKREAERIRRESPWLSRLTEVRAKSADLVKSGKVREAALEWKALREQFDVPAVRDAIRGVYEECAKSLEGHEEALGWLAFDAGLYEQAHRHLGVALATWEKAQAAAEEARKKSNTRVIARPPDTLGKQVEVVARLISSPKDAVGLARRANAWALVGNCEKAIADYTQVIDLAPKSALARCWRASSYIAGGAYALAQRDIDSALALAPQSAQAYACRGALHQARLELDAALTDYDKSLELSLQRPEVCVRRALIHFYRGNLSQARDELRLANFLEPADLPWMLPMRLTAAVPSGRAVEQPSQTILPERDADGLIAIALTQLVRGDIYGGQRGLSAAGKRWDWKFRFAQGVGWIARDEDQDLFYYRRATEGAGWDAYTRSVLRGRSFFEAAGSGEKPEHPGQQFAAIYAPINDLFRAENLRLEGAYIHDPYRYYNLYRWWGALDADRAKDPLLTRLAEPRVAEDQYMAARAIAAAGARGGALDDPQRLTNSNRPRGALLTDRLRLLRQAMTAPTHLYDDPLAPQHTIGEVRKQAGAELRDMLTALVYASKDQTRKSDLLREQESVEKTIWGLGWRPWKTPLEKIAWYKSHADRLIESKQTAAALSELNEILNEIEQLRTSDPKFDRDRVFGYYLLRSRFAGETGNLVLALCAADAAIDVHVALPGLIGVQKPLTEAVSLRAQLHERMGDLLGALEDYRFLSDTYSGGADPLRLTKTPPNPPTEAARLQWATWFASRGALQRAVGAESEAPLDFAAASLYHPEGTRLAAEMLLRFAAVPAGVAVQKRLDRLQATAKCHAAEERPDLAIACLEAAVKLAPKHPEPRKLLAGQLAGRAWLRQLDMLPDLAIADFEAAVRLTPDDVQIKGLLAQLLSDRADSRLAARQLDPAIADLEAATRLEPAAVSTARLAELKQNEANRLYQLGQQQRAAGDLAGAEKQFVAALGYAPRTPLYLQMLSVIHGSKKEKSKELVALDRSIEVAEALLAETSDPKQKAAITTDLYYGYLFRGMAAVEGNIAYLEQGERDALRASELDPKDHSAHATRGKCLFLLGRRDDAQFEFDLASAYNAKNVEVIAKFRANNDKFQPPEQKRAGAIRYLATGSTRLSQHDIVGALADSERGLKIDPEQPRLLALHARARFKQGQVAEAAAELTRSLDLEPETALYHVWLGECLLALDKPAEADAAFSESIKRFSHAEAFAGRAIARARLGRLDDAVSDLSQGRRTNPDLSPRPDWPACEQAIETARLEAACAGNLPVAELMNLLNIQSIKELYDRADKLLDRPRALALLSRASEQNLTEAQLLLGRIYTEGREAPRDLAAAADWFARAAANKEREAANYLEWLAAVATAARAEPGLIQKIGAVRAAVK